MDKIIITGFEKFGDYLENSTEVIRHHIKTLGQYEIVYLTFPVRLFGEAESYGQQLVKLAQDTKAKAIISLGMASDVFGVRIESQAFNWVDNKKYCLAEEQNKVVNKNYSYQMSLNIHLDKWNIDSIQKDWQNQGLSYEPRISEDPGRFCCNALIFRTIIALKENRCQVPYLFLHLPCTKRAVTKMTNLKKINHLSSVEEIEKILSAIVKQKP